MSIRTVLTLLREAIDSKLPAEQQGTKTIEQMTAAVHSIETGSGSMEIYKCVDAEGMTWIVVSGAGSPEANGYYYRGDDIWSGMMMGWYAQWYQKDESCILDYGSSNQWQLKSGSTVLYADESWSYYDGDPSQCTNWVVRSGVSPVPTLTTETTTGNGWTGRLYDPETGTIADTETELTYAYVPPKIGKYYTADGIIGCDVTAGGGLVFYAPLNTISNKAETGQSLMFDQTPQIETIEGVSAIAFDGSQGISCVSGYTFNTSCTVNVMLYQLNSVEERAFYVDDGAGREHGALTLQQWGSAVAIGYGGLAWDVNDSTSTTISKWITLSLVCNRENGTSQAYKNGVLIGSKNFVAATNLLETIYLGKSRSNGERLNGYIAEVKVWNYVLSAEEIKAESDRCLAMVTEG